MMTPALKTFASEFQIRSPIQSINANSNDIKIFGFIDNKTAELAPSAHMAVVSTDEQIKTHTEQYKQAFGSGSWKIELFTSVALALAWDPESA